MEISSSNQFEFSTVNLLFVLGGADWCMEENISFKVDFFCPTEPNSCWAPKLAPWKIQLCICTYKYIHMWYMYINIYTICVCVCIHMAVDLCQQSIINPKRTICSDIAATYTYSTWQKWSTSSQISLTSLVILSSPFPSFKQQLGVQRSSKLRGVPPLEPKRIAQGQKKQGILFASCQSQIP